MWTERKEQRKKKKSIAHTNSTVKQEEKYTTSTFFFFWFCLVFPPALQLLSVNFINHWSLSRTSRERIFVVLVLLMIYVVSWIASPRS